MLVLDRRLAAEFSVEEAERVVPFLADAIAVALGTGHIQTTTCPAPFRARPIRALSACGR